MGVVQLLLPVVSELPSCLDSVAYLPAIKLVLGKLINLPSQLSNLHLVLLFV